MNIIKHNKIDSQIIKEIINMSIVSNIIKYFKFNLNISSQISKLISLIHRILPFEMTFSTILEISPSPRKNHEKKEKEKKPIVETEMDEKDTDKKIVSNDDFVME